MLWARHFQASYPVQGQVLFCPDMSVFLHAIENVKSRYLMMLVLNNLAHIFWLITEIPKVPDIKESTC